MADQRLLNAVVVVAAMIAVAGKQIQTLSDLDRFHNRESFQISLA